MVVCGDAACIWEDLERFGCRKGNGVGKDGWDFLTINGAVCTFPGTVHHSFSNVGAVLQRFVSARRDCYAEYGPPLNKHCIIDREQNFSGYRWPWVGGGTSGLGGILTAIGLGYKQVVIAGMPLDNGPHNGEPPWRRTRFTTEVDGCDQYWTRAISVVFEGKVKSLSGRTREWLGEP